MATVKRLPQSASCKMCCSSCTCSEGSDVRLLLSHYYATLWHMNTSDYMRWVFELSPFKILSRCSCRERSTDVIKMRPFLEIAWLYGCRPSSNPGPKTQSMTLEVCVGVLRLRAAPSAILGRLYVPCIDTDVLDLRSHRTIFYLCPLCPCSHCFSYDPSLSCLFV